MSIMATTAVMDAGSRLVARLFEQTAITVPAAGNTNSYDLLLQGRFARVSFELDNTVQALDACKVQAQVHPNGAWFDWVTSGELSAGVSIAGRLVIVMTDPTTLAAGSRARFVIDTAGLYGIRLAVSAAVDSAILAVRGAAVEQASSAASPSGSGAGDYVGPGSSTDNAIHRFNGTSGKLGQNSAWTIDDTGNMQLSGAALFGNNTAEIAFGTDAGITSPTLLSLAMDDGAGGTASIEISAGTAALYAGSDGIFVNASGASKGTTATFTNASGSGGARFYDSDSSNYMTMRLSSNLSSNTVLTWVATGSRTITLGANLTVNGALVVSNAVTLNAASVTGSKATGAALQSLLTVLATAGVITDNTTA